MYVAREVRVSNAFIHREGPGDWNSKEAYSRGGER